MIKKLAPFIGQYKKYALVVPLLVFLDVLAELSMPLLMARIIDVGIPSMDIGYIARTGGYMVLLALAGILFGVLFMYSAAVAAMGFGANLRNALFEKVQAFSFNNIDRFSTASLITRLTNDANNVQMTLMMMLRILIRAPMMLVVAFFLAYSINARLSLVLAVAIPILTVGVAFIMNSAVKRFSVVQGKIDAINNVLQENLIGVRAVKSFVRQDFEIGKFKAANDGLTNAAIRAVSIVILNMPLMMLVMNGATLAVIWQGGRLVGSGEMGAGGLVSFISYIMQILMSVMMLSMVVVMSARAKASAERIVEVLDTPLDILDKPQTTTPAVRAGKVEFRDVDFKYDLTGSGENVLSGISFTAEPGQVIGIVGGTGSGKTTLVTLIPRLYDATAGAVLVDGVDVRDYPLETLRQEIGVVLQKNTLFSGTIRDNLRWGNPDATQAELETASRAAQAHDFILDFPDGYDTLLGQGGVNLSGGQKQRLSIARAMLKKPKILILDDSTSAVDSTTESRIRQAFQQELHATTVFIIAQRISSVHEADQILVIEDGRIAGQGTHAELLAGNRIYQEIDASQQEGVLANV
ncbi:MAG TPA: ABC transporter ATP-binding protein [Anaerolineales bacterium]|nr:ABC transporter ATP-binding protein [Anaerolineales bacterium]